MNDLISRQAAIDKDINVPINNTNDLIRRGDAIDAVYERIKQIGFEDNADVLSIRQAVREVPFAQSERKTGRWILWNYPGEECAICSACGEEYDQMELYIGGNDYPKYCPDCGARMEIEG